MLNADLCLTLTAQVQFHSQMKTLLEMPHHHPLSELLEVLPSVMDVMVRSF